MAARNRVRTVFALAVLATAISPMPATLQAALTDVFSVNFYAYNGNPVPAENVTLEAEQSALLKTYAMAAALKQKRAFEPFLMATTTET